MRLYEKKDNLIRKNPNLTEEQKKEIIKLLNKYPSYESKVDWNKNTSLTYKDFYNNILKPLYIKELNPKGLVKGKDYDIVPLDKEDEVIYVVYTYNASKILASNSVEPKIWTPLPYWCGEEEFKDEAHAFGHFDSEHKDMKPGAKWCISMQISDKYWKDYKKNYLFFFWFVDDPYFSDKWKKNAIGVDKENGRIVIAYDASDNSWYPSTDLPNQGALGIPKYIEEAITDFFKGKKEREEQKELRKLKSQLQFNKETNRYDYTGDLGSEFLVNFVSEDKKGFILNFGKVTGDFSCSYLGLTSLEGAPREVGRSFYCNSNQLTSLKGAPQEVGESFSCWGNKLISLEGVPQEISKNFDCSNNNLTSLEGAPQTVGGNFDCSWNQLTSLEGAPVEVKGHFNCSANELASFKGAPKHIGGDFYYVDNPDVKSLEGLEGVNGEIHRTWDF